ncbi:benzoate 4-monooxygenase cytochrome P450 [Fusarium mexicanum]|uniref:Benzoate 4-monooxygenase cytochrome P450 n=1 Tax=Fusarium mexicanum TaxID=751941 RepID=A0A8H5JPT1_9HYPO|nr:benzoate 4-monooxygenase cytochrome P450 [Fusarium mexicanum]
MDYSTISQLDLHVYIRHLHKWLRLFASLALAIVLFKLIDFFCRVTYRLYLSPLRKFPGPRLAAISNAWEIYHSLKNDRFRAIHELHEKHGNVVRIGPNQVSVASPETFHHVFVTKCSSFLKTDFYATIQPGIGPKYAGLFNYINHKQAMAERRDLQPLFSPGSMKHYEAKFDEQLDILMGVIKQRGNVDLFGLFKFFMLDVIGDLALNKSFGQVTSGKEHQYVVDFNNAFMLIGLQNTFAPIIPLIPYLPFNKLKDAYYGLQRVFSYSQERVEDFLKQDRSKKQGSLMSGYLDPTTGEPKDGYSAWSIALAGHGFIVAGSEATSITLTYIIWMLIKHPDVDHRLRLELSSLGKSYSNSDLANLPYLDAVIRETLRIYPPAPSPMPRVVPKSGFELEGVSYPPDTVISAQPYTIHRYEGVFEDPVEFRPERWLNVPPEKKDRMYRAFVPFSAGQRGKNFARVRQV